MAGVGWNGWRALRARARTLLVWQTLDGADGLTVVHPDGSEVIVIDPELGRVDRHAVLTHELVHLERGVLPSGTPDAVIAVEERAVRAETVRRLVPLEELAGWVAGRVEVEPVTARCVASEFDVPVRVAERALAQLRHPRSAGIRREYGIE